MSATTATRDCLPFSSLTPIEKKRRRLASAQRKLTALEGKKYAGDELSAHFHLGTAGAAGKPSQRLNARRDASIERMIDNAKECIVLRATIQKLTWQLAQPPRVPKPPKATRTKAAPTDRERAIYLYIMYGGLEEEPQADWTPDEMKAVHHKYRNGMPQY